MPVIDQVRCEDISLASDHRESKERDLGQQAEEDVSTEIVATFLGNVYQRASRAMYRASVPHNPIDRRRDTD